jgi:hypothetical protein
MATSINPNEGMIASGLNRRNRSVMTLTKAPIASDIRKKITIRNRIRARQPIRSRHTSPIERPR